MILSILRIIFLYFSYFLASKFNYFPYFLWLPKADISLRFLNFAGPSNIDVLLNNLHFPSKVIAETAPPGPGVQLHTQG